MVARLVPLLLVATLLLARPVGAGSPDAEQVEAILSRVAALRRLEPTNEIQIETLERAAVAAHLREAAQSEEAQREAAAEAKLLRLLGQLEDNVDLGAVEVEVLGARIQGMYRPEDAAITVVSETAELAAQTKVTLAHELTHALQDQHFNLTRLTTHEIRNSDRDLAIQALVEGDASMTAQIFAMLSLSRAEIQQWNGQGPSADAASQAALGPLPGQSFTVYDLGTGFVEMLLSSGGWDAVNDAYARPPQSTEQLLHPRKYLDAEMPNLPLMSDSAARLGRDWRVIREDTLGELGLMQSLEYFLPAFRAVPAAAGWGGDRYHLLELGEEGPGALLLVTQWDSQDDAREFFASYADAVGARYGMEARLEAQEAELLVWRTPDGGQALFLRESLVTLAIAPTPEQASGLAGVN